MSARTRRMPDDACAHRLGDDGGFSLDQLPDPAALKLGGDDQDPLGANGAAATRAGFALGESFFKLLRPEPDPRGLDVGGCFGWLGEYAEKMACNEMRAGFFVQIENLLQLALMYPERLPTLCGRLDALDNAALAQNLASACAAANYLEPDAYGENGGLFAGLTHGGGNG